MIGSQAVADEVKTELGDQAKDMTVTAGGATPTLNGIVVLVLIHAKTDKPNSGKYLEVSVLDDQPLDDQVKAALQEGGFNVTFQTASEKKTKQDAQKAPVEKIAPTGSPTTPTPSSSSHR